MLSYVLKQELASASLLELLQIYTITFKKQKILTKKTFTCNNFSYLTVSFSRYYGYVVLNYVLKNTEHLNI